MRKHLDLSRKLVWPGILCVVLAVIAALQYVVAGQPENFTFIYLYAAFFLAGDVMLFLSFRHYQKYIWQRDYHLAQLTK